LSTNFDDVGAFHERFGLPVSRNSGSPRALEREVIDYRIKFLKEELQEFIEGFSEDDNAKMFDALLDLVYVALGTAHFLNYPWQEGWNLVQKANMAKVRAKKASESKRNSTWDVVKPPGWTPPDIASLLKAVAQRVSEHPHSYLNPEPKFTIRARDILSVPIITRYGLLFKARAPKDSVFDNSIGEVVSRFIQWQKENANLVRYPD